MTAAASAVLVRLERAVGAALGRAGFSGGGAALVVAASGGPDSTALLRCLHRLAPGWGLRLHVAHLNHDFRGAEADHDAAFVQRLADGLGLPASIDKQDPVAYQRRRGRSSFEQAAREMRYAFLSAVAQAVGAATVVLGHTADDQAETVLLHLLRGAGLHGLRGMAELAAWPWPDPEPGPRLFRPLLAVSKGDTAEYCRALGQLYRQDSGNYMWRFTRNRIRQDLMPRLARDYNPRVGSALNRLSRAAAEEVDYIESELARCWADVADESGGRVVFRVDALRSLHPALQRQALRRGAAAVAGDARRLRESHLEAMLSLLRRRGGRAVQLPRGVIARREGAALVVGRGDVAAGMPGFDRPGLDGEYPISLPESIGETVETAAGGWRVIVRAVSSQRAGHSLPPLAVRLKPEALEGGAMLRAWRPGDRFQPLGMAGTKKLQDFFTDVKIPRERRDRIPLLVGGRGIAWIAGWRVAEWAAAQDDAPGLEVVLRPAGGLPDSLAAV